MSKPYVFLQWKGTDACMDFHCLCDRENEPAGVGHFDGFFASYLKCVRCGRVYKLPTNLELELVDPHTELFCYPQDVYPDEEE